MATLLHIDSSALFEGSVSREVSAAFRTEWEAANPGGTVIYRDLALTPTPHLDAAAISGAFTPADQRTPEQLAAHNVRDELISELEQADHVVIGAPMYNFAIPSSLKAWIDQVVLFGRTAGAEKSAAGTPVTVIASRGGSYAAGSPRESFEFATNYVEKVLTELLGLEVTLVVPEFTMAKANPALAEFVETAEASKAKALQDAAAIAKATAERVAV
ncbi:FMN-dependent NADH-azoreductase [Kitasatospora sp. MAP12-15]|uniref:FMN-dependent NADH-azoreductase n=1 Tax=unclassified Kitasatospora TaxID=2633591 RepID=UPI0024765F75|nr:NAD(P)H-dependent oxidoreductase [Kitasatospora sp. MAP12-44]MDH6111854.1 FMN-dependent NADH-azoreductase [Kitasatospora sp. MAP12-44]